MDYALRYYGDFKAFRQEKEKKSFLPTLAEIFEGNVDLVIEAEQVRQAQENDSTLGTMVSAFVGIISSLMHLFMRAAVTLGRFILANPAIRATLGVAALGTGAYALLTKGKSSDKKDEEDDEQAVEIASSWSPSVAKVVVPDTGENIVPVTVSSPVPEPKSEIVKPKAPPKPVVKPQKVPPREEIKPKEVKKPVVAPKKVEAKPKEEIKPKQKPKPKRKSPNLTNMSPKARKKASIIQAVVEGAEEVGVDPKVMLGIVKAESSFGQFTKNSASSATGIFQILPSTWREHYPKFSKKYHIPKNDPNDPESAAVFSAAYVKEVLNPIVKKIKGKDATAADLYMLYVFGPGGGAALIREFVKDPNALSATVHSKRSYGPAQIKANPTFFYRKDGSPKTLTETFALADSKVAFSQAEKVQIEPFVKPKAQTESYDEEENSEGSVNFGQEPEKDYEIVSTKQGRLVKVEK